MSRSPDPILSAHLLRPGFVDLSGKLSPGSIRDQILRAHLVSDALWREGLLGPKKRVLIIGAGAAGVASSLLISGYGAKVWLAERSSEALSVIRGNTVRVVSPALYDWPASHWMETTFGPDPLVFAEGAPVEIAARWIETLNAAVAAQGNLHWVRNVEVVLPLPASPPFHVTARATGNRTEVPPEFQEGFDFLFCCAGGVTSEESVPWVNGSPARFPFFRFWDPDPFPGRHQTHPFPERVETRLQADESARVVIVGGGDGGLQDYLRFVTGGVPVREILEKIVTALHRHHFAYRVLYRLFDSSQRAILHFPYWDSARLGELHADAYAESARQVEEVYVRHKVCRELLRPVLKDLVASPSVVLVQNAPTLGRCYALNRFLALLVDAYLRDGVRETPSIRFGWSAQSVQCDDDHHAQSGDPADHYTGTHLVTLSGPGGAQRSIACRAVVSRMGPPLRQEREIRQVLPFWTPQWGPPRTTPIQLSGAVTRFDLSDDRGCRSAIWRALAGFAVIKDSRGRALHFNRRFAAFLKKTPEEIYGRSASQYAHPDLGRIVEANDDQVRSRLESLLTFSNIGDRDHYTFRFPYPIDPEGMGSASIGFDFRDIETDAARANDLPEPTSEQLERFFEWLPCSVAITDMSHKCLYGNQAFRRVLSPIGFAALPTVDLYNYSWDQILTRLNSPVEREDPQDSQKRDVLRTGATHLWQSPAPFNRNQRLVVGFPLRDERNQIRALASIGFQDILQMARDAGSNSPLVYEIEQ